MILNFRVQRQILPNWCWAAVTSSVSFFFNRNNSGVTQGAMAGGLISNICSGVNAGNAGTAPVTCNETLDVAGSLRYTGNYGGEISRPLAFNEIIQQINSGYPVCCQIYWEQYNQSHFVTIYGYETSHVIVGDPDAGIFSIDYNQFLSYRGGAWRRSIGTRHP